ncbi:interferon-induced very large GTPase 1-like [Neoarius graeffei]|uniref:interferon-induced very large GTPase 1-like n=1 Tax=Neoarius graeffei TaxID=443677 RepID=UPI00298C7C90|nr:interferon-induced very large GTPase 1-like [Neoarius graeffei]XP_060795099.1 interferon-induced very large GTPase 1-like [Neoarius graeffei]
MERKSNGVEDLLLRLGLKKKYEDKLTSTHFLEISKSTLEYKEPSKENELVHVFMQRLLTGDYRARHISVRNETNVPKSLTGAKGGAFADLFKKQNVKTERKQAEIHPMDVQMAVFLCADHFLQQIMVTKLAQCQYAIPLLVPNPFSGKIEFPLWTMRQINKSWKSTDASGQIISETRPVSKAETPMVAFFRLGSVSSSKSQLINNLINERHNTFFHRHCPGSSRNCLLMDGVVEIAWYCPSGKSSDHFTECVAFCNLHGDSSRAVTQREILTTMASVNIVLLPKLDENDNNMRLVEELCKSPTPLIVVLTDEENDDEDDVCEIGTGKYRVELKSRSQSNASIVLRNIIRKCLSQKHRTFNLEKMTNNSEVSVDEHNEACKRGKEAAQNIMGFLKGKDPLRVKEKYLPCQGKLWHDWCQTSKDLRRLQSNNIENELSNKKTKMKDLRRKQQEHGFSDLMKLFVDGLISERLNLSVSERVYFLRWTEIGLTEFTSEKLSTIQQEYYQKWIDVHDLKKQDKPEKQKTERINLDKLKAEESNLKKISKELNATNFGLEHMLREMGQIYEASVSEDKSTTGNRVGNMNKLPELAAKLMISGHPMELMDGDAAYVPLTWVSAVFDEVIRILGDQRVFVLSVLGIQSSGKSTMLNAMFGLQFAVSAGRCTRGAFMQLVRVSEDMKEEWKIDYILVVDIEGLRAPELAGSNTIHHDNQLSTFVVGLGNMTLINIFGENPTEMQEILQIGVHAFLRMKKVRLNPSCMFVHQNVSDIAAREKILDGRRNLQETLDKMTKLAAKDEDYCTENFTDVIAFDVERDVKYFSQLWEGSPPMAPPNPCYSENIQELKRDILSHAKTKDGLKLSQFQKCVKDLWNSLLDENLVFSFKNAQEISVYRRLEQKYGNWTRSLMTVQNKMLNRVASGIIETDQMKVLEEEMAGTLKDVQNAFKQYFEEDNEKETLIQWKCRFETQIQHLHDDLIEEAKRKVDDSIQQRQNFDQQHVSYEKTLFEKSKELASRLKRQTNCKMDTSKEFDSLWEQWVSEITKQAPKIKDVNISNEIMDVLGEVYKHDLVSNRKRSSEYRGIGIVSDYSSYIPTSKGMMKWIMGKILRNPLTPENLNQPIHDLINQVTEETKKQVESFPFSTQGYNSHYIQRIAQDVKTQVQEFETRFKKDQKLSDDVSVLTQDFYVDLSLYVCEQSAERISELHRKFREVNDPLNYFEKKRDEYFNIFQKYYEGATSAAILGDRVCGKLKEAILQSVYNKIALFVSGQMREKAPFNGNRADLEKHILKSLAEQKGDKDERFKNYLTYMYRPKVHFEEFIKARVKEFMAAENPKAVSVIEECIDQKQTSIITAATKTTDEVKRVKGDANQWLDVFTKSLADELGDTRVQLCDEECKNSIDFDILVEAIRKELPAVVEELKKRLSKISHFSMEKFRERPDEILIKHFCGCCWKQCPFCGAVCTHSQEGHPGDHNADYHRSAAVRGICYRGTTEFCIEFCTTKVASDRSFYPSSEPETPVPYKDYRKAGGVYPEWGISPDFSTFAYWKWFVCEFQENLEKRYNKQFCGKGKIPAEWKKFTLSDAVKSLRIH